MLLLRALLSVAVLPGTVAVVVPWRLARDATPPAGMGWIGLVPLGLGVTLFSWCIWDFATRGRSTLAPWDAPRGLVVSGPYRYVRNPPVDPPLRDRLHLHEPGIAQDPKVLRYLRLPEAEAVDDLAHLHAQPLKELDAWLEPYRRTWDERFGLLDDVELTDPPGHERVGLVLQRTGPL